MIGLIQSIFYIIGSGVSAVVVSCICESRMKNRFSMEEEIITYDGPWEPYVRDFDPTLNMNKLFNPSAPLFYQVNNHIKDAVQENRQLKNELNFDENAWTKANTIFFEHQKQDLLLSGHDGSQWVVLSKYADTGRYDLAHDKLMVWNWLYGCFVSEKQLATLKEYAAKGINLLWEEEFDASKEERMWRWCSRKRGSIHWREPAKSLSPS